MGRLALGGIPGLLGGAIFRILKIWVAKRVQARLRAKERRHGPRQKARHYLINELASSSMLTLTQYMRKTEQIKS